MTTSTATEVRQASSSRRALRHRWPSVVAIAFAALIVYDLVSGVALAPVLAITAAVYVGSAAFQRRAAAWPLLIVISLLLTAVRLLDPPIDATWVILAAAVLLLAYGLVRGAWWPADGLPRQSWALLLFGTIAIVALAIDAHLGAYLVAAGLVGHAAWDARHHRSGRVVARTFAEFCFVLDLALAAVIVVITALS